MSTGTYNYNGFPAPQVYNANQVGYANADPFWYQLVTCGPYGPGSGSYRDCAWVAAQTIGAPYAEQFGTTHAFEWENKWQPQ